MKESYKRRILTSIMAIIVSVGMICSGTFAWYMRGAINTGNKIQTASYNVAATLNVSGEEQVTGISKDEDTGIYTVINAGTYEFVLSATGDSTGYCIITITKNGDGDNTGQSEKYCIEQIAANENGTNLTVHMNAAGSISFETVWGTYIAEEGTEITQLSITEGSYIIGEPVDQDTYNLPKPGDDTDAASDDSDNDTPSDSDSDTPSDSDSDVPSDSDSDTPSDSDSDTPSDSDSDTPSDSDSDTPSDSESKGD